MLSPALGGCCTEPLNLWVAAALNHLTCGWLLHLTCIKLGSRWAASIVKWRPLSRLLPLLCVCAGALPAASSV